MDRIAEQDTGATPRQGGGAHRRRRRRRPDLGWSLLLGLLPAIATLGITWWISSASGVDVRFTLRDAAAIHGTPRYYAALTNAGALLWAGGGMICLFAAAALPPQARPARVRAFLVTSGLLSLFLAADDLYLMHEGGWQHIGIANEREFAFFIYVPVGLAYLAVWGRFILRHTDWRVFAIAVGFLGVTFLSDLFVTEDNIPAWMIGAPHTMLEEGSKFLAICMWTVYFIGASLRLLKSAHALRAGDGAPEPRG